MLWWLAGAALLGAIDAHRLADAQPLALPLSSPASSPLSLPAQLLVWSCVLVLLAGRLLRPQARVLRWDGRGWHGAGHAGSLVVALDMAGFMLLRLDLPRRAGAVLPWPRRRCLWLAVTAREAGADWRALRTAVYSGGRRS